MYLLCSSSTYVRESAHLDLGNYKYSFLIINFKALRTIAQWLCVDCTTVLAVFPDHWGHRQGKLCHDAFVLKLALPLVTSHTNLAWISISLLVIVLASLTPSFWLASTWGVVAEFPSDLGPNSSSSSYITLPLVQSLKSPGSRSLLPDTEQKWSL